MPEASIEKDAVRPFTGALQLRRSNMSPTISVPPAYADHWRAFWNPQVLKLELHHNGFDVH